MQRDLSNGLLFQRHHVVRCSGRVGQDAEKGPSSSTAMDTPFRRRVDRCSFDRFDCQKNEGPFQVPSFVVAEMT